MKRMHGEILKKKMSNIWRAIAKDVKGTFFGQYVRKRKLRKEMLRSEKNTDNFRFDLFALEHQKWPKNDKVVKHWDEGVDRYKKNTFLFILTYSNIFLRNKGGW